MRYLRISAVCLFVISLIFAGWANLRYYSNRNTDMPVITSQTDLLEISVADGPEALLEGLTARDETDGDLTDQIMVATTSHFLERGLMNVKYVVFDRHHNAGTLNRKVRYTDYESPRFSLSVPGIYARGQNFDLLKYIGVEDCIEGDISNRIRVVANMVNMYAAGVYPVTLEITNSCGDMTQLTIWVTVLNQQNSATIALDQYIVYVDQGSQFDPYSHITGVTDQTGAPLQKELVQASGSIDMNTPGSYMVEYSYAADGKSGFTTMTVVVRGEGAA